LALSLCCRVSTYGGCIICSRRICIVAECPILQSAKSWALDNVWDSGSAEEVNMSEYEQQKTLENSKMLPLEDINIHKCLLVVKSRSRFITWQWGQLHVHTYVCIIKHPARQNP
jgi:hypothetical protein